MEKQRLVGNEQEMSETPFVFCFVTRQRRLDGASGSGLFTSSHFHLLSKCWDIIIVKSAVQII